MTALTAGGQISGDGDALGGAALAAHGEVRAGATVDGHHRRN